MKLLLVIFLSFVFVALYIVFRVWRFFRKMVSPANQTYRQSANPNAQAQNTIGNEVLYSDSEVVVLKGEAKDKSEDN